MRVIWILLTLTAFLAVSAGCGGPQNVVERTSPPPAEPAGSHGVMPGHDHPEPSDTPPDEPPAGEAPAAPEGGPPHSNPSGTDGTSPPPATDEPVTIASNAVQPHMAIGEEGIYVVFLHQGNIAVSVSRDGGHTFSSPVIAIDVQGRARGGAHRGPRIGVDARNRLTVTAPVTFDDAEYQRRYPTADLFFVTSRDGGQTWTQPVQVNEVTKKAPEALHWMAVAPSGEVHVSWLDLRSREQGGQDLYYARLVDGNVGPNEQIAATVCECCAPGMTVDAQGNPFVAFREGGSKASREIFARHSTDGGRSFTDLVQVNRTKTLEDG